MARTNRELAAARAAFPSPRWTLAGSNKTEDAISLLRYRYHQAGTPISYHQAEDIVFKSQTQRLRKTRPTTPQAQTPTTPRAQAPAAICDRCFTVRAASGECMC